MIEIRVEDDACFAAGVRDGLAGTCQGRNGSVVHPGHQDRFIDLNPPGTLGHEFSNYLLVDWEERVQQAQSIECIILGFTEQQVGDRTDQNNLRIDTGCLRLG